MNIRLYFTAFFFTTYINVFIVVLLLSVKKGSGSKAIVNEKVVYLFALALLLTFHCFITSSLSTNSLCIVNILANISIVALSNFRECLLGIKLNSKLIFAYFCLTIFLIFYFYTPLNSDLFYWVDNNVVFCNYFTFLVINVTLITKPKFLIYVILDSAFLFTVFYLAITNCARTSLIVLIAAVLIFIMRKLDNSILVLRVSIGIIPIIAILALFVKPNSTFGRLLIIKNTLSTFSTHFIVGIGLNNFPSYYNIEQSLYFKKGLNSQREQYLADNINTPDNEFLQYMTEFGIICFIVILFSILKLGFKDLARLESDNFTSVLIKYITVIIFLALSAPLHNLLFATTILWFWVIISSEANNYTIRVNYSIILLTCLLPISTLYLLYNQFDILSRWKKIDQTTDISLSYYKQYKLLSTKIWPNEIFFSKYCQVLFRCGQFKESEIVADRLLKLRYSTHFLIYKSKIQLAQKQFIKAEITLKQAVNIAPGKFTPRSELIHFYLNTNDSVKARLEALAVLKLPVKVPSSRVLMIKNECYILLKSFKPNAKYLQ